MTALYKPPGTLLRLSDNVAQFTVVLRSPFQPAYHDIRARCVRAEMVLFSAFWDCNIFPCVSLHAQRNNTKKDDDDDDEAGDAFGQTFTKSNF